MAVVPLDEARRRVAEAYKNRDARALALAVKDYRRGVEARRQSAANIQADQGKLSSVGDTKLQRLREGAGSGFYNVGRRATAIALPEALTPEFASRKAIEEQTRMDAPLLATGAGKTGRFIGEVAATAVPAGMAGRTALGAGRALDMARLGRYGGLAAEGAAGSALTQDDATLAGAATGVVGGRLLQALGGLGGAAARGMRRDPAADVLLRYGADLTPGQMRPDTMLGRIERTAAASPILGSGVQKARAAATHDVVPNLSADIAGIRRVAGEGLEGSAIRRGRRLGQLYDPAETVPFQGGARLDPFKADYDDVVQKSIDKHLPRADAALKDEMDDVWVQLKKAQTTGDIKRLLSDMKATRRGLKYKTEPKPRDFQTALVYDDVINHLDELYEKALKDPDLIEGVQKGAMITAGTKPIERATVAAMKKGADEIQGTDLLRALSKTQKPGQFARGEGGEIREVADALAEIQRARPGGIVERSEIARTILGTAAVPTSALGATKPIRRIAQGRAFGQQTAQKVLDNPKVARLLEALAQFRAGVPGAYEGGE